MGIKALQLVRNLSVTNSEVNRSRRQSMEDEIFRLASSSDDSNMDENVP
jgi:hypothetical protein